MNECRGSVLRAVRQMVGNALVTPGNRQHSLNEYTTGGGGGGRFWALSITLSV